MGENLKLGLNLGYWAGRPPSDADAAISAAERLGFDSIWTGEAYGSDCLTPLAWWGSNTENIRLGTSVMQISARQPAATAMAAMTMDHLCSGRFVLGLGVSGPQVVEGWYGMPFPKPLQRTREYIGVIRDIWAREAPVVNTGDHYPLPLNPGSKPLKSSIHPLRSSIPIYLGAEGPKNISLAAELCDGWLAAFFAPSEQDYYRSALNEGFALRTGEQNHSSQSEDFEIAVQVPIVAAKDVESAADQLRPMYALYFGGMGSKKTNFHANVARRMGYEETISKIQRLYLEGNKDQAAALVPTELITKLALVGPVEKIRDDLEQWRESIATTLLVTAPAKALPMIAELVLG